MSILAYNLNINKTENLNNSSTDLQGKDVQYKQSNINTSCTDINGKFDAQTIISEKDIYDTEFIINLQDFLADLSDYLSEKEEYGLADQTAYHAEQVDELFGLPRGEEYKKLLEAIVDKKIEIHKEKKKRKKHWENWKNFLK